MSCPGEEVHNSTPCRPHSKALLHRNDGNLRKLGRLLYPLFHISRTHADDGPKKSSPASGTHCILIELNRFSLLSYLQPCIDEFHYN